MRGEWQPCAGDNNCLSVGEGCERRVASVCAQGTSQRGVGFVFTFHSVNTGRKDRNSKFRLKYKLCSASAAKFVFPNRVLSSEILIGAAFSKACTLRRNAEEQTSRCPNLRGRKEK